MDKSLKLRNESIGPKRNKHPTSYSKSMPRQSQGTLQFSSWQLLLLMVLQKEPNGSAKRTYSTSHSRLHHKGHSRIQALIFSVFNPYRLSLWLGQIDLPTLSLITSNPPSTRHSLSLSLSICHRHPSPVTRHPPPLHHPLSSLRVCLFNCCDLACLFCWLSIETGRMN
jgi:hypothetical protein